MSNKQINKVAISFMKQIKHRHMERGCVELVLRGKCQSSI